MARSPVLLLLGSLVLVLAALLLAAVGLARARPPEPPPAARTDASPVGDPPPLLTGPPQELPWRLEYVDRARPLGLGSLGKQGQALDGDGLPRLAYAGDALYYAWYDGNHWQREAVDTCGQSVALALEPVPPYAPHIGYGCGEHEVRHAYRADGGWVIETVEQEPTLLIGQYLAIALEPSAPYAPHLSYRDASWGQLRHAWWTGSGWNAEVVGTDDALYTSLTIAATAPYTMGIGYCDWVVPKYAWALPGGAWAVETVDAAPLSCGATSLALEPAAPHAPRLVYYAGSPFDQIRYAWRTAAGWTSEALEEAGYDLFPSLALEATAPYTPHVSYRSSDFTLRHAWRGAAGWTFEDLPCANGELIQATSLGLKPASPHYLHIAYNITEYAGSWDRCYLDVIHLYQTAAGWNSEIVEDGTVGGIFASLALEAGPPHMPHMSYGRRCAADPARTGLIYASWAAGRWISETVIPVGQVNASSLRDTSLALEPLPPYTPHIAYEYSEYASENSTFVQHAWLSGTAWLTETIGRGHSPSIAIAPGPPYTMHVAYVNIWDGAVTHAWLSGTVWLTETATANAGLGTALALEPTYPYTAHIVYFTEPALSMVGHAWQIAGGWNDEPVETAAAATAPALAIASTPPYTIHVSYGTGSYGELRYAWKSTDGWHRETVDTGDIYDTALVLVPTSDSPRVVYCNGEFALQQARQTAAGWDILTLDGTGCAHPSMAQEATAPYCPHVGYQDEASSLKHAWIPRPVYIHLPLVVRRAP